MNTPTPEEITKFADGLREDWERRRYVDVRLAIDMLDACAEAMRWATVDQFEGSSRNVLWLRDKTGATFRTQEHGHSRAWAQREGFTHFHRLPPPPPHEGGEKTT